MSQRQSREKPPFLLVGEVLRPHGVRGELRLRILTDYPERIGKLKTVYLGQPEKPERARPYRVEGMRMNGEYGLLKLHDIDDRDAGDRLREQYVMVSAEDAVPLDEGEFYLYELIGLNVQMETGEALGTLIEVLETGGANDVYLVRGDRYGEVLIPVLNETILKTDVDAGIITVRLPEGLLQPSADDDELDT